MRRGLSCGAADCGVSDGNGLRLRRKRARRAGGQEYFYGEGRPSDNPLIVHVAGIDDVAPLVTEIPGVRGPLWSGFARPNQYYFKKSDKIGDVVSAGLDTVAVRMPSHPVALAVIQAAGVPVAAPSANDVKPSPTAARHVRDDMYGKIDMIIDGGRCGVGVESTVLTCRAIRPLSCGPAVSRRRCLCQSLARLSARRRRWRIRIRRSARDEV